MSLVTRCPACSTTFKVVRDQLRVSDGWVRCGRCSQVFDATIELQETADEPSAIDRGLLPQAGPEARQVAQGDAVLGDGSVADVGATDDDVRLQSSEASMAAWSDSMPAQIQGTADQSVGDHGNDGHQGKVDEFYESDAGVDTERPGLQEPSEPSTSSKDPMPPSLPFQLGEFEVDKFLASANQSPPPPRVVGPVFPSLQPLSAPDEFAESLDAFRSKDAAADALDDDDFDDDDIPGPARPRDERPVAGTSDTPDIRDTPDPQFSAAVRRAQIKSAKIARARAARTEKPATTDSAPMVLAASEADAEHDAEPEGGVVSQRAPMPAGFNSTRPAPGVFAGEASGSKSKRRRRSGRRMSTRATLLTVVVLSALLLVAQVLRHERDTIVARQPSLRPLLAGLCGLSGCSISALKHIGDITIDGASFTRERTGDGYRLSFTLRNAASEPLAMPAVELSLLDLQEQTLVRRVIMPFEFTSAGELPGRSERSASLAVSLRSLPNAGVPVVSGYRVVAFYP